MPLDMFVTSLGCRGTTEKIAPTKQATFQHQCQLFPVAYTIIMFFSSFLILTASVIVFGKLTTTLDTKSFRRFHLPTDITDAAITNRTEVRL